MLLNPYRFGGAPVYPGTFDILMHMDGANGGTTFTEENGKTVTRVGSGVVTSTAQKKFGSASATGFSGSSRLTVPHSALVGDFTLGLWVRSPNGSSGVSESMLSMQALNMQLAKRDASNNVLLWMGGTRITAASALSADTWTLVVLDRYSGVIYLSVDGVVKGSYSYATDVASGDLTIGAFYDGTESLQSTAFADEVFLRKDGSMWSGSSFTPPASPFTL